jgi:photosystem II stability/assembly factor-like uncharacterized protein
MNRFKSLHIPNSLTLARRNRLALLVFVLALGLILPSLADHFHQGANKFPDGYENVREAYERESTDSREPETDSPDEAMRWRRLAWADEKGEIPDQALMEANRQRQENIAHHQSKSRFETAGLTPSSWTSRGPQNIGGRTRALVIHPSNRNILWAGSVSGGIWKSTNAGTNWAPLNDFLPNLAANCLAISPADPNTLYCGTGEGYFNTDAVNGAGIFKTTDGGTTWNQLPATANWESVNRIAISPTNSNIILAARRPSGIYRSTDGGQSWVNTQGAAGALFVAFDPSDGNKAVAHVMEFDTNLSNWFHWALYSTNAGATWQLSSLSSVPGFPSRIELAYAPSSPNIVYASLQTPIACPSPPCWAGRIWRSTNGGQTYTMMTPSGDTNGSWYANPLWVSPTDPNFLVFGGFNFLKSTDAGVTFTQISGGYILTQDPHPDEHFVVSDTGFNGTTNKRVYVCTDGGIYRTDDITTANFGSGWVSLNNTYQTTQYYAAAGNATTGLLYGGTQDNGTLRSPANSQDATYPFGGDGGFCAVDPVDDSYCYGEYIGLQIHRSQDHGVTSNAIYFGLPDAVNQNAAFVAPFILDPNERNRMIAGGISLWRSDDVRLGNPPTWNRIRPPGNTLISSIAVAQGNSNIIWIAFQNGEIYKTTNGLATTPTWNTVDDNAGVNPLPDRFTTRLLIDPANSNIVYVSFGGFTDGNLRRTTDGGANWTDVTGTGITSLPLAPIRGIARHPNNPNWLYVGTEVGIFSSEDGGATWSAVNQGPANVVVDELTFLANSTVLLAATHGRGLWTANASGATGTQTLGVYYPNDRTFYLRNSNTAGNADLQIQYGPNNVTPIVGDWNGDGTDTIGVYDSLTRTFYLRNSNTAGNADIQIQYGPSGVIPIVGDWDGNGTDTIGVYDPATRTFYLRNSNTAGNADIQIQYGPFAVVPVTGDWDGDGTDTIGVYETSTRTFYLRNSNTAGNADIQLQYGPSGSVPVVGDFDGNGSTTIGIYETGTRIFYLRNSNTAGNADITVPYGPPGATPFVGDWNGL